MILGGLELCVSRYLSHVQSGLRWRAAQLVAACAQNMPQVQEHLLQIEALPKLLKLTDSDPNPTVRVKALYAVSCKLIITRDAESELSWGSLSFRFFKVVLQHILVPVCNVTFLMLCRRSGPGAGGRALGVRGSWRLLGPDERDAVRKWEAQDQVCFPSAQSADLTPRTQRYEGKVCFNRTAMTFLFIYLFSFYG